MRTKLTEEALAQWLKNKFYLTDNCHHLDFSGTLGIAINGALTAEQEEELLLTTKEPPTGSTVYKYGTRSFVGTCSIIGTTLLHKYYHRLSLRRQIGYSIWGSRAFRSWIAYRALHKLGIPTPQPIALFEYRRFGNLADCSLLVTSAVKGMTLEKYLQLYAHDKSRITHVANQCRQIFLHFAKYRIYHGDAAPRNFLVNKEGKVFVIDLDATKILVPQKKWPRKHEKDKHKLLRYIKKNQTAYPHFLSEFTHQN